MKPRRDKHEAQSECLPAAPIAQHPTKPASNTQQTNAEFAVNECFFGDLRSEKPMAYIHARDALVRVFIPVPEFLCLYSRALMRLPALPMTLS